MAPLISASSRRSQLSSMSQKPQPFNVSELLNRANASLQQNGPAEAEYLYRRVVGSSPDHLVESNNYGKAGRAQQT